MRLLILFFAYIACATGLVPPVGCSCTAITHPRMGPVEASCAKHFPWEKTPFCYVTGNCNGKLSSSSVPGGYYAYCNIAPTADPTSAPSPKPVAEPTAAPSPKPVAEPTSAPSPKPVADPISAPAPKPVADTTGLVPPVGCSCTAVTHPRQGPVEASCALHFPWETTPFCYVTGNCNGKLSSSSVTGGYYAYCNIAPTADTPAPTPVTTPSPTVAVTPAPTDASAFTCGAWPSSSNTNYGCSPSGPVGYRLLDNSLTFGDEAACAALCAAKQVTGCCVLTLYGCEWKEQATVVTPSGYGGIAVMCTDQVWDPTAPAKCCTNWNKECYTTISAENNLHACRSCGAPPSACDSVCSSDWRQSGDLAMSTACQECCQTFDHETDWNCPAAAPVHPCHQHHDNKDACNAETGSGAGCIYKKLNSGESEGGFTNDERKKVFRCITFDCGTITRKNKCKQTGCGWNESANTCEKASTPNCADQKGRKKCRKVSGCFWKNKTCQAGSAPAPSCANHATEKKCKKSDACMMDGFTCVEKTGPLVCGQKSGTKRNKCEAVTEFSCAWDHRTKVCFHE